VPGGSENIMAQSNQIIERLQETANQDLNSERVSVRTTAIAGGIMALQKLSRNYSTSDDAAQQQLMTAALRCWEEADAKRAVNAVVICPGVDVRGAFKQLDRTIGRGCAFLTETKIQRAAQFLQTHSSRLKTRQF